MGCPPYIAEWKGKIHMDMYSLERRFAALESRLGDYDPKIDELNKVSKWDYLTKYSKFKSPDVTINLPTDLNQATGYLITQIREPLPGNFPYTTTEGKEFLPGVKNVWCKKEGLHVVVRVWIGCTE